MTSSATHYLHENLLPAKPFGARTVRVIAALLWAFAAASLPASQAAARPAPVDLNASGPEALTLSAQAGTWTITETVWAQPGAQPLVIKNLIAERRMIGNLLEESLASPSNPSVLRRDFLTFNRVEGRWEYMSFDTRAAVGMMTAQSHGPEVDGKIELVFQPFALPASGTTTGQMLRMRQQIIRDGEDHVVKDQYFTLANGRGEEWLAHRYDATRRRSPAPNPQPHQTKGKPQ